MSCPTHPEFTLSVNTDMCISSLTASGSLSKGQTWILCFSSSIVLLPSLFFSLHHSLSLCSSDLLLICSTSTLAPSLSPGVCFLWFPVEVEKVSVSFSTITLLIVLTSLLFSLLCSSLDLSIFNSSLSKPNYSPFLIKGHFHNDDRFFYLLYCVIMNSE